MKTILNTSFLLLLFTFIMASGCNKDDDALPTDLSRFFRMNAYEVGVVPESRTVQVLFQVTDFEGKGVSSLTTHDFVVTENGGNIDSEADLRVGRGSIPFSLRTVLLLDLTRSVEGLVPQIKNAAKALINQKLPEQEIAIYTFDSQTTTVLEFTTDKAALLTAIEGIPETGLVNSTNLYGAIIEVSNLWEDSYSIDGIVDGSMVIFTDGRHNATPQITLSHAIDALGSRRAYVAALTSPDLDEAALRAIADEDERYFIADDVAGLETMFTSIQTEIQGLSNSIYFLYYQSPISEPSPYLNELKIEVEGNVNNSGDGHIVETFNSVGFGG